MSKCFIVTVQSSTEISTFSLVRYELKSTLALGPVFDLVCVGIALLAYITLESGGVSISWVCPVYVQAERKQSASTLRLNTQRAHGNIVRIFGSHRHAAHLSHQGSSANYHLGSRETWGFGFPQQRCSGREQLCSYRTRRSAALSRTSSCR